MSAEYVPLHTQPLKGGVICAGGIVLDTLVKPFDALRWGTTAFVDSLDHRVGGSAANTARALGILGVPVRLAGMLGPDAAAVTIRRELLRCGVDEYFIETAPEPTAATIVLVNRSGDRQFLHRKGCSELAFHSGLLFTPQLVANMTNFHLASLFVVPHLRTNAPGMLRDARAAGLTTSLDTCWDPQGQWMIVLKPCLPHLDILFLNEDEAAQLYPISDAAQVARMLLAEGTRMVVLKRSRNGATIYVAGEEIACPPYSVESCDSTGAGDCFVAGFLVGTLEGLSPLQSGLLGNAAGALSVQQVGAVEGLLSREEVGRWMSRTPSRFP